MSSTWENAFPMVYGDFNGSGRPVLPVLNLDPPTFMRCVLMDYFNYLWGEYSFVPIDKDVPNALVRVAVWHFTCGFGSPSTE
jgi:hypothetical protein